MKYGKLPSRLLSLMLCLCMVLSLMPAIPLPVNAVDVLREITDTGTECSHATVDSATAKCSDCGHQYAVSVLDEESSDLGDYLPPGTEAGPSISYYDALSDVVATYGTDNNYVPEGDGYTEDVDIESALTGPYTMTIYGAVEVDEGCDWSFKSNKSFVIQQGASLTVNGAFTLNGALTNNGTIVLGGSGTMINNGTGTCGEGVKHLYQDGICLVCKNVCPHTGGTATCVDPAVCTNCGLSYGCLAAHTPNEAGDVCTSCGEKLYPILLGGVQVTDDNAADILGDGTASYDAATGTLTLNGASVNASALAVPALELTGGTITLDLQGTNALTGSVQVQYSTDAGNTTCYGEPAIAIAEGAALIITGDETATLTLMGSDFAYTANDHIPSAASVSGGSLTVAGGTITTDNGIRLTGDYSQTGGQMTASFLEANNVTVSGGTLESRGNSGIMPVYFDPNAGGIHGIFARETITVSGGIVTSASGTVGLNIDYGDYCVTHALTGETITTHGLYALESISITGGSVTSTGCCGGYFIDGMGFLQWGGYGGEEVPAAGAALEAPDWSISEEATFTCGSETSHRGGTATCATLAACQFCGEGHGDLNPDNHVSYNEYGYCTVCETECVHTPDETTGNCTVCGNFIIAKGVVAVQCEDGEPSESGYEEGYKSDVRYFVDINSALWGCSELYLYRDACYSGEYTLNDQTHMIDSYVKLYLNGHTLTMAEGWGGYVGYDLEIIDGTVTGSYDGALLRPYLGTYELTLNGVTLVNKQGYALSDGNGQSYSWKITLQGGSVLKGAVADVYYSGAEEGGLVFGDSYTGEPISFALAPEIIAEGFILATAAEGVTLDRIWLADNDPNDNLYVLYDEESNSLYLGVCTAYESGGAHVDEVEDHLCDTCGKQLTDHEVQEEVNWYLHEDSCYVNLNASCTGCDLVVSEYGYAERIGAYEGTTCQDPSTVTYSFTYTYDGTEYTVTETLETGTDPHIGFDAEGFCTACGGYQKPTVDPGEDPEWDYDDVYLIYNAGQLYWFADHVNNVNNGITGKLMDDIGLNPGFVFNADGTYIGGDSPRMWTPIGSGSSCYAGNFDGNGFTVSGVYVVSEGRYVGLFGNTDYNYTIKNLGVTNSYFKGADHVGGLIGYAYTTVKNCYVTNTVYVSGSYATAALIGYNGGEVYNSYAMADTFVDTNYGSCYNCYALTEGDGITVLTAEDFTSGKAAYLLQSGVQPEDIYDEEGNYVENVIPDIWGQTIGEDAYPVVFGDKVYQVTDCKGNPVYSNTNEYFVHIWNNGKCIVCGATNYLGWTEIDGNWYYFYENQTYASGVVRVLYPAETINGITYDPDQESIDYAASKGQTFIDETTGLFIFDENGVFQSNMNGLTTDNRWAVNGHIAWHVGLVQVGEDYYYFQGDTELGGNKMATGDIYANRNTTDFDMVVGGVYTFGADGKLCKYEGITDVNGTLRYYENAQLMLGKGLIHGMVSDGTCAVTLESYGSNKISVIKVVREFLGLGLKEAKELVESAPVLLTGSMTKDQAEKFVAALQAAGATASMVDNLTPGGYCYVTSDGSLVVNSNYWVAKTNGFNIVEGEYDFDENGYLIEPRPSDKNGVYFENGAWYYYVDGKIAYNKGMISVNTTWHGEDGSENVYSGYIYVRSSGKLATGTYYITNVSNDASGLFTMGMKVQFSDLGIADAPKNGIYEIEGELYYFVNNQIQYNAGLIEYNGGWIYVRSSGKLATGKYWITNTNGNLDAGMYEFGEDGYLVITDTEDGIVNNNGVLYYYEDGKKLYGTGLKQLSDGSYIYVRTNGELAVGSYWITNHNGLLPEGLYTFGEDGILVEN